VEASLQLRDDARAAEYAERIVALNPNDIPLPCSPFSFSSAKTTKLRSACAVSYATRVIDFVNRTSASDRSHARL